MKKKFKISWVSLLDDGKGSWEGTYTDEQAQKICESMNRAYKGKREWTYTEVSS